MGKTGLHIGFLFITAVSVFYISNHYLEGYLRAPVYLGKELKSPEDSLYRYNLSREAPFKYRLLFTGIVKGTYKAFVTEDDPEFFYQVYKFWSVVFYTASVLAFFWLLSSLGYTGFYPVLGALIFLGLPPMLVAFTLPVHTREDTLAYTILFVGLIAMLNDKKWLFLLMSIIGALTRETLLLLPLLYFFFINDKSLVRKLVIAGLPVLVWLGIRLFLSPEKYDVWQGLKWNLSNPVQVAGFLFITFNVFWIPFLFHVLFYRSNMARVEGSSTGFFHRSALFTLLTILVTTFAGGIFNEIRLLYLFSPWIIVLSLDFLRHNGVHFKKTFKNGKFGAYAAGAFTVCCFLAIATIENEEDLIEKGIWMIPYNMWVILTIVYIFISLLFLPVSFRVFVEKKSTDEFF